MSSDSRIPVQSPLAGSHDNLFEPVLRSGAGRRFAMIKEVLPRVSFHACRQQTVVGIEVSTVSGVIS